MCTPTPVKQKLPEPPAPPPPPEETAQLFATTAETADKQSITKKKRGTAALKVQDISPLAIPSSSGAAPNKGGLFIP